MTSVTPTASSPAPSPPASGPVAAALNPLTPAPTPDAKAAADDAEQGRPREGMGLCLSGGGYRAMVFHIGSLWRLNELGLLRQMARISSVSGGSITAGTLALRWDSLTFDGNGTATNFVDTVVAPLREMAGETIDADSILGGIFTTASIGDKVAKSYDEHLFHGATLQDITASGPRFIINATNVQSGALWRFSRKEMRDYRVGRVPNPTVKLSVAVAASSAFPPVLSPVTMRVDPASFAPPDGTEDLHREPFTKKVVLSDGGVYDNLGLETVWKRCETVLVSDGGGKLQPEEEPHTDWGRHGIRVMDTIDNQVRSLRKRQMIGAFADGIRKGTYWGIRTDVADYGVEMKLDCPFDRTMELASLKTRLKRMEGTLQERLINWGYAVCDAALRRHVNDKLPAATRFPYPNTPV